MSGILAAIILTLATQAPLTPWIVCSNPSTVKSKGRQPDPAGYRPAALTEFSQALREGKLTLPGRVIESAGRTQR